MTETNEYIDGVLLKISKNNLSGKPVHLLEVGSAPISNPKWKEMFIKRPHEALAVVGEFRTAGDNDNIDKECIKQLGFSIKGWKYAGATPNPDVTSTNGLMRKRTTPRLYLYPTGALWIAVSTLNDKCKGNIKKWRCMIADLGLEKSGVTDEAPITLAHLNNEDIETAIKLTATTQGKDAGEEEWIYDRKKMFTRFWGGEKEGIVLRAEICPVLNKETLNPLRAHKGLKWCLKNITVFVKDL